MTSQANNIAGTVSQQATGRLDSLDIFPKQRTLIHLESGKSLERGPNDQILAACHRPEFGKTIHVFFGGKKNWRSIDALVTDS